MWFSENNVDYVADLSASGVTTIEKAVFPDPTQFPKRGTKGKTKTATEPTDTNIEDE